MLVNKKESVVVGVNRRNGQSEPRAPWRGGRGPFQVGRWGRGPPGGGAEDPFGWVVGAEGPLEEGPRTLSDGSGWPRVPGGGDEDPFGWGQGTEDPPEGSPRTFRVGQEGRAPSVGRSEDLSGGSS